MAFNPATCGAEAGYAYVANSGDNSVSVINPFGSLVATIHVGNSPSGVAFNPATTGPYAGDAYVTNNGGSTVSVINTATNTVIATIGGFNAPEGVAFSPSTTGANAGDASHRRCDLGRCWPGQPRCPPWCPG